MENFIVNLMKRITPAKLKPASESYAMGDSGTFCYEVLYECSKCKQYVQWDNYCSSCGSPISGEEDNEQEPERYFNY